MFEEKANARGASPAHSNINQGKTVDSLTEGLAQLLDAEDIDIAKIDEYLEALDEVDPQETSFDEKASLEQFHTRYNHLSQVKATHRRKHYRNPVRLLLAAAVAVVLIGSLLVQAVRYDFWDDFFSWTEETFRFSPQPTASVYPPTPTIVHNEDLKYTSIQDALDVSGSVTPAAPKQFPNGFLYESINITALSKYSKIDAILQNGEAQIVVSIRIYPNRSDMGEIITEKDSLDVKKLIVDDVTHYLMDNNGKTVAVWLNNDIYGMISGDISTEEMEAVILSVYN